jgi:hypothetical protein
MDKHFTTRQLRVILVFWLLIGIASITAASTDANTTETGNTTTSSSESSSSSSSSSTGTGGSTTVVVQNSGGGFGFVPFSPLPFLPPLPFPAWFPPTQSVTIIQNTAGSSSDQAINLKILELMDKILKKLEEGKTASGTYPTGFDPENPPVAPTEPPKLADNADPNDPEVKRIMEQWETYNTEKAEYDRQLAEWNTLKESWDREHPQDETNNDDAATDDADAVLNE